MVITLKASGRRCSVSAAHQRRKIEKLFKYFTFNMLPNINRTVSKSYFRGESILENALQFKDLASKRCSALEESCCSSGIINLMEKKYQ